MIPIRSLLAAASIIMLDTPGIITAPTTGYGRPISSVGRGVKRARRQARKARNISNNRRAHRG